MSRLEGYDFSEESNNVSAPKKSDLSPEKLRNAFKNDGSFLEIFKLLHQDPANIPLPTDEAFSPPAVLVSTPITSTSQLMPMTSPSVDSQDPATIPLPTDEAFSSPAVIVSTPLSSTSQLMPMTSPSVDSGGKIMKKKSLLNFVGKLRGGKVLPTGVVKKPKRLDHVKEGIPKNAMSHYLKEVQKYKEVCCEEEGKTRALLN